MARSKWVCSNRWRTPSRSVSRFFIIDVLCSRDIPYFEPHCPFSVVTQRCLWGGALRCVASYPAPDSYQVATYSFMQRNVERKIDERKGAWDTFFFLTSIDARRTHQESDWLGVYPFPLPLAVYRAGRTNEHTITKRF